jgi:hypothetical protein
MISKTKKLTGLGQIRDFIFQTYSINNSYRPKIRETQILNTICINDLFDTSIGLAGAVTGVTYSNTDSYPWAITSNSAAGVIENFFSVYSLNSVFKCLSVSGTAGQENWMLINFVHPVQINDMFFGNNHSNGVW